MKKTAEVHLISSTGFLTYAGFPFKLAIHHFTYALIYKNTSPLVILLILYPFVILTYFSSLQLSVC